MAIFPRRTLQRLIDENAKFLSPGQVKSHVDRLNRMPIDQSLNVEWEVVLINGLSKIGRVVHEKQFGGSRKGDIYFETADQPSPNFLADVTTISDRGIEKQNPFQPLFDKLMHIIKENGLRKHSFRLEVGTRQDRHGKGGPKVQLKIPGESRFTTLIFNEKFYEFLGRVARNPTEPATYTPSTDEANVRIIYDPNQKFASGGHTSYKVVYSLNENTLYSSLLDKAEQLRGTGFVGPFGIFVCDGGYDFLSSSMSRGLSYEPKDVIHEFLRDERSREELPVQFVVTFRVGYNKPFDLGSACINLCLYTIQARYEAPIDVMSILKRLQPWLPIPERNAVNAIGLLKGSNPNEGASFWGGLTMSERRAKISARALLGLLAGTVSQEQFFKGHGFIESEDTKYARNPFQDAVKDGRLIAKVSIETVESRDDDWITLEFGEPDAAVLPYVVPSGD